MTLKKLLFTGLETETKWQVKTTTMGLITALVDSAPEAVNFCIPEIVPVLSDCIWDTKAEVNLTLPRLIERSVLLLLSPLPKSVRLLETLISKL